MFKISFVCCGGSFVVVVVDNRKCKLGELSLHCMQQFALCQEYKFSVPLYS